MQGPASRSACAIQSWGQGGVEERIKRFPSRSKRAPEYLRRELDPSGLCFGT